MIKKQAVPSTQVKLSPIAKALQASIIGVGLIHGAANAATIEVNTAIDISSGFCPEPNEGGGVICNPLFFCTLRNAVDSINLGTPIAGCIEDGDFGNDDRITFADTLTFSQTPAPTITLDSIERSIEITEDVIIDGAISSGGNVTIDSRQSWGAFDIEDSTVTLSNLTLTGSNLDEAVNATNSTVTINNSALYENSDNSGAGLEAIDSTVTINSSSITNNSAQAGAGILAIRSELTINDGDLSNNAATTNSGGGLGGAIRLIDSELNVNRTSINNNIAGYAAAIGTQESLVTITESDMSGNFANRRGGAILISRSTAQSNPSSVSIYSTTLSDNSTNGDGGAIVTSANSGATEFYIVDSTLSRNTAGANGGAVWMRNSSASILNTTFSGNIAQDGDGGAINLVSNYISLSNTTITNNTASDRGSGIFVSTFQVPTPIFHNSILAGNNGNDCESNLGLTSFVIADSFNIIQNDACSTDARNIDPMLGPLANNGGATLSHALLPTSPARNSGDLITCTTEDQRGQLRNNGDNACDVGAIEFNPNDDFGQDEDAFYVIPLPDGKTVVIPL